MVRDGFYLLIEYFKKVDLPLVDAAEAFDDDNFEKSCALVRNNPSITKEEFCKEIGIEYDEEFRIFKDYLNHIRMPFPYKAEIFLDKNYEKGLKLFHEKPNITKEEFIKELQLTGVFRGYNETSEILYKYLKKIRIKKQFIEDALGWENYPKTLDLYKQNPSFTKKEFMSFMGFIDKKD